MFRLFVLFFCVFLYVLFDNGLFAQGLGNSNSVKVLQIDEIMIKGQSLKSKNSSAKVDIITNDEIKNLVIEQPLRILEQVSGINVIGYGQGGVADQFSIRGFAGGGHGGEAGVEIDGISLNEAEGHSDGYADLNVLIPLNLKKVSVYKGPSSALFGRFAQGGMISLETRKGGNYHNFKLTGGSYKTLDVQYAMGKTINLAKTPEALKTNFAIQLYNTDGYIQKSGILKGNISGRVAYQISPKSEIALSLLGHRSEWDAPGYIPKEQYENKSTRNQPHHTYENDGGSKLFLSERVDYSYNVTNNIKLLVFGYALQQNFTRYAKFSYTSGGQRVNENTRNVFALGTSLNGNTKLANKNFDWIVGGEFYTEKTARQRFSTSFRRKLGQTQDRIYNIQSFSLYTQGELDLHKLFRPTIGLRFDIFDGSYANNDIGQAPFKGSLQGLYHFSPKLGFRSTLVENFDFRANVSNGFSLPSGDYSENKYGNRSLKSIELWQYELGFVYSNKQNLHFDITGFILNTSREILERPIGSGNYVNAGKTQRMGIEADAKVKIIEDLELKGTFTYTHTKITEGFINTGKQLTQLPDIMFNLGATYTSPVGIGVNANFRKVADYFTDDENTFKAGGYNLANLKLFYNFYKSSAKGNIFVAVNNLFNEYYAETVFGKTLFSASPTRNFSIGITYSF